MGDHMHHGGHRWGGLTAGRRKVGVSAGAGQLVVSGGQRDQGISAALPGGAWILLTHRVRDLVDPAFQQHRVGGIQPAPQGGEAGLIGGRAELHLPAVAGLAAAPQRAGIMRIDQRVDGLFGLGDRQCTQPVIWAASSASTAAIAAGSVIR